MEVSGSDGVKFFWEIIEDHDFEETNCNGDIELRGVGFNCFYEYGGVQEFNGSPYLLFLIEIWLGNQ